VLTASGGCRPRCCQPWRSTIRTSSTLFTKAAAGTAWRTKPSWYIVASEDRTVRPELERFAAKRMGTTAREIAASHVPMLSHPDEVLEVIRCAADALS
jgi:pimeloyl-ACP methyl ester carboxylesterase